MINIDTTFEEWKEYTTNEKEEYVSVIVSEINKKDGTTVDPKNILDKIEERFGWGQYIKSPLSKLISDTIALQQRFKK